MSIELSETFFVDAIKKKTQAQFFKDLQVGDEFTLVYNLNGYYKGSPVIEIWKDGKYAHENNALQLRQNLENFSILEAID